jgi:hypothetical protein
VNARWTSSDGSGRSQVEDEFLFNPGWEKLKRWSFRLSIRGRNEHHIHFGPIQIRSLQVGGKARYALYASASCGHAERRPSNALACGPEKCMSPEQAAQYLNKNVCIFAYVHDVVVFDSGGRFLDRCADSRDWTADAWTGRDGVELSAADPRRNTKVQGQSPATARICRGGGTASDWGPESAIAGWTSRVHELAGSGTGG